ncbi:hypothetical protein P3T25_007786 [Paraburkholderia sp. GAS32]
MYALAETRCPCKGNAAQYEGFLYRRINRQTGVSATLSDAWPLLRYWDSPATLRRQAESIMTRPFQGDFAE